MILYYLVSNPNTPNKFKILHNFLRPFLQPSLLPFLTTYATVKLASSMSHKYVQ